HPIPYTVNKSQLVERIAEIVLSRKLPHLIDVKDLSTEDVRIALEMKKDADEKMVMAYLFKHTPLQLNVPVNLTCLIPTENPEVGRPERLDLKSILWHFLHFRLEVVTNRLQHELAALKKRIHILEGVEEIQRKYSGRVDKRRTSIASDTGEPEYTSDDFIVDEDNVVIVSRDGWVKRQKEVKDLSTTRLREGDFVLAAFVGSTRAAAVFFSNFGVAYTSRIIDVPASTGYGEPIQKQFKLKDGEKIVGAMSLDPRVVGVISAKKEGDAAPVHAVA